MNDKNKTKSKGLVASAVLVAVAAVVAVLLVGTASAYYPERAGTVGYWHFDEGGGSVAYDSSGEGNDGTIYGAGWTSGKVEGALGFDGLDDFVEVPDDPSLDITDEITVEFWINPAVYPSSYGGIWTKGYNPRIYLTSVGHLNTRLKFVGLPDLTVNSVAEIPLDTWTHFALSYDGNQSRLYINGELDCQNGQSGTLDMADGNVIFGEFWGTQYFNGRIDEARILNRALSSEEIEEDYRSSAIIFVTTDRENYTIGETVLMTLEINRSEAVPREMSLELGLKKPGDDEDLLYNSGAFWMPAEVQWSATVPFPIEYSIWIPSGEYCFIGTLRNPSTGDAIASDRACFYVDDVPSKSELEAVLAIT